MKNPPKNPQTKEQAEARIAYLKEKQAVIAAKLLKAQEALASFSRA
jgi:hypothetical protein